MEILSSGVRQSIFQMRSRHSEERGTGNVNSARRMFRYRSCMLEALNGTAPQTIAYRRTPKDHMSTQYP